jgi:hypothetical protein
LENLSATEAVHITEAKVISLISDIDDMIGPPQFARTTLVKEGYTTTKKREKHNFDVDDLMNVFDSLWTEGDSVFIHEAMRI